jgi:hypothetical protein
MVVAVCSWNPSNDGWMDGLNHHGRSGSQMFCRKSQMSKIILPLLPVTYRYERSLWIPYSIVNEMGRESDLGRGFIPLDYVTL